MEEELTEEEWESIETLRKPEPCIILNDEAREILEGLLEDCHCPGCQFVRQAFDYMDLIESHNETSH